GAVIVGAVAGDDRQSKGLVPGAHEVIGSGLRGGVGRVRLIAARLGEFAVRPEGTEYLVSRDVVKPEGAGALGRQPAPVVERGFQQQIGALDLGLDKNARSVGR